MDSKQRAAIRTELASQGFAWNYVDSWPPKTDLYVHKPMLNPAGQVVMARGTLLTNMPGQPDFMARKSRIGLLPWPPGETCKCKACREAQVVVEPSNGVSHIETTDVTVARIRRPRKNSRATTGRRTRKGE